MRNSTVNSGHPISSSHVMAGIAKGAPMPGYQQQKEKGERRNWSARASAVSLSQTPSVHTIVSDTDGVEPIDYEEYVSTHSERDQVSRVLQFPEDDIDVNLVQRKIRTEQHVLPEEAYEELDPAVQNCVDCYTSDWVVVNRKYQQYSTSLRVIGGMEAREAGGLARHQYECDSFSQDVTPQEQVREYVDSDIR